jgi:Phage-related baseplate assembly protein
MSLDPTRYYTLAELTADGEPEFFIADPIRFKSRLVSVFADLTGRTLYEGQVEMYMIEIMSYALAVRAAELQYAVIQRLLAFATEDHLDRLAANFNTYRLKAAYAGVKVRFSLSAPRPATTVIPAKTRVRSADGDILFLTDEEVLIQAGTSTGEAHCTADTAGTAGNGVAKGEEFTVIDPVAGVASCIALDVSAGGTDEEGDGVLRQRAAEAWETISRGGPRQGYEQLARGAHPAIVDVAVIRPQPCEIRIYPLCEIMPPGDDILTAIADACEPRSARPEGDELFVLVPTAVTVSLTLNLIIDGAASVIEPLVEARVLGIFDGWRQALGARLSTAVIIAAARSIAGVVEVTIDGLSYRDLADDEYAVLVDLSINTELA